MMTPKGFRALGAATVALALATAGCSSVPPVPREASSASAAAIVEAGFVRIGGIEQWVTIRGRDRRNPVVLFLHGGPGIATSPFAEASYAEWEGDFTIVQWDQRGAGRTYARNGAGGEGAMTVDRMVEDGIEVAEYLRRHLGHRKIVITGGSWGSVLGLRMAHARPDLFHAYVGLSQSTHFREDQAASFGRVREIARSKGDQPALATLDDVGPPPWDSPEKLMPFRRLLLAYQQELATAPANPIAIASEYQEDFRSGRFQAAGDFSQNHFFGPTLSGPLFDIDNTAFTEFAIPVFLIHGEVDLTIPVDRARRFFETIRAPRKAFHVVPGTGHDPSAPMQEVLWEVLLEEVRPVVAR